MIYNIYTIYHESIYGINFEVRNVTMQMIIRIDPELKDKLAKLARIEGKNTSQLVREVIENYINERDISAYVDDLWKRIGNKLESKGIKSKDIDKAIKDARKSKSQSRN